MKPLRDEIEHEEEASVGEGYAMIIHHVAVPPAHLALRCFRCCTAALAVCLLLTITIWASGAGPSLLYLGATFYVDFNMWRQSLDTPTTDVDSGDQLAAFVWHEESGQGTVDLRPHLAAHATYEQHAPFPHTVIDGMVPHDLLERVIDELPEGLDEHG